ncbi:MAG: 5-methyltetrahydropteroyltriglutamate--homocysteine S-methyltransferase [Candidatus Zixiibacteriota bacterium]|nr:MAG: 5-methyltetrahydropteroyltriglutamate--homocysteine S-methyltransferase [candidate division Zixibacteria bacterium]
MAKSANLGFPRLGANREWKWACEKYWAGKISQEDLLQTADELRSRHWDLQREAGIQVIPCNDFSFYDHMLDTAVMVGAVPPRYGLAPDSRVDLDTYFAMARGRQDDRADVTAMEMTKWFDTNYHYIVPEFDRNLRFHLASSHPFIAVERARAAGIPDPRPVMVGPATFLLLGKAVEEGVDKLYLVDSLAEVYVEVLRKYREMGLSWVQIDEPVLVTDLDEAAQDLFRRAWAHLIKAGERPRIMLATYFGPLESNLDLALASGAEGLHLDLARGPEQLDAVLDRAGDRLTLSLGVVNGRNVWRTDLDRSLALLRKAAGRLPSDRLEIAPSCSLLHVPMDLAREEQMDVELREWLAFAVQKLGEVSALTQAVNEGEAEAAPAFAASRAALVRRRSSSRVSQPEVRRRQAAITKDLTLRPTHFAVRRRRQQEVLQLPLLPSTTIGSFPQTEQIRKLRAEVKKGSVTPEQMEEALKEETLKAIRAQEDAGLDVLVHGEFERTDMVEYFAAQMDGFLFTDHGWVQSYGSRAVKPPIIFGDVRRRQPMTVKWSAFAQSASSKPMKGMLTGPITLLKWSFVRDDQPRSVTAEQLALAIRDEVLDLEKAGVRIIQIDEPALREGMPLRRREWDDYLIWAVRSFRLASSGVKDETQIHTHMCYSEFNEIIRAIAELDADVISIEASRSRMELLQAFREFEYPYDVGPGVWDIHSPRVPTVEEIVELLREALRYIPVERLWVNPDCGLKTRRWEEVLPSLRNMVAAARVIRKSLEQPARTPLPDVLES